MGIFGALTTAVGGLLANSYALENVSGNIANSQTTGYKRIETSFSTLLSVSNSRVHEPGGVLSRPKRTNDTQGPVQQTSAETNLALSGAGFFAVNRVSGVGSGGLPSFEADPIYTRAGDFAIDGDGYLVNSAGYYLSGTPTEAGTFNSLEPSRILDTRVANGVPGTTKVAGNGEVDLEVAGRGGVPASGAVAVVLNVTAVDPTTAGYVTVYPHGTTAPLASNLNFTAGKVIPNLVTVLLGADGHVALKNGSPGQLHLIADVAGYYLAGSPTVEGRAARL